MKFSHQRRSTKVQNPLNDEVRESRHGQNSEKKHLQSTWKMVDGQLICQWTTVSD
ncbi:MAG: hypothetical protein AAGD25_36315 [Cyanobacteria bacterium P01_F01_bin.150]